MKNIVAKLYMPIVILACIVGFILLSQPVWRGEEMKKEFIADCEKRGGVLLIHEKTFGDQYKCESRLD